MAEAQCGYPEPLPDPPQLYDIPDSIAQADFPEVFNTNFTIRVTWDPDSIPPAQWPWPIDSLKQFTSRVMPDPGEGFDPWDSIAQRVVTYFGHDTHEAYDSLHVKGYNHFFIQIYDHGIDNSTAGANIVYLNLPAEGHRTVARVLADAFAHEWEHLVEGSIPDNSARRFANLSTTEYFAHCASYLAGWYYVRPEMGGTFDIPYFRSLTWYDYFYSCDKGHSWSANYVRHGTYAWFKPALLRHYDVLVQGEPSFESFSNLLYLWIHREDTTTPVEGDKRRDLAELGLVLEDDDYDTYFLDQGRDARVREMFQAYVLSLFVNRFDFASFPDSAIVWSAGDSPQYEVGYLQDFDGNCHDDAHSRLYYSFVEETPDTLRTPIYPKDLHDIDPECSESEGFPRALEVSTYGSMILPFVAAESIRDNDECYDLRVDITLEEIYLCLCPSFPCNPTNQQATISLNDLLHIDVLGYPTATDQLDLHGAEAELLISWEADGSELEFDEPIAFSIPGFGTRYKSVAFVMTLTEVQASEWNVHDNVLPFWVEHQAVPSGQSGTLVSNTTWPDDVHAGAPALIRPARWDRQACVDDILTVGQGVTLTIEPDTDVFCTREAAFYVYGEMAVGDAQAAEPARLLLAGEEQFTPGGWGGLFPGSSGSLVLANAELSGTLGIYTLPPTGGAAAVDIQDAAITLTSGQTTAGLYFRDGAAVSIDGLTVNNSRFIRFDEASTVQNLTVHVSGNHAEEAISLYGDATLTGVTVDNALRGIECFGSAAPTIGAGPNGVSVSLSGRLSAIKGTAGILATESSSPEVSYAAISGFEDGVRAEDTADLTLRNSRIENNCRRGVHIYPGGAMIHLGDPFGGDGENCISSWAPASGGLRVFNRSASICWAHGNYWDAATPTASLFGGTVYWNPYLTYCLGPGGGGGGGYSLGTVGEQTQQARLEPTLEAYPNPFNPSCTLRFALPHDGSRYELAVYGVDGRLIATLDQGQCGGQTLERTWQGRDLNGKQVSSGVYLARLKMGAGTETLKLMLVQ